MCDKFFNFESSMKRHFKEKHENKIIETNIGFVMFETLNSSKKETKKVSKKPALKFCDKCPYSRRGQNLNLTSNTDLLLASTA